MTAGARDPVPVFAEDIGVVNTGILPMSTKPANRDE